MELRSLLRLSPFTFGLCFASQAFSSWENPSFALANAEYVLDSVNWSPANGERKEGSTNQILQSFEEPEDTYSSIEEYTQPDPVVATNLLNDSPGKTDSSSYRIHNVNFSHFLPTQMFLCSAMYPTTNEVKYVEFNPEPTSGCINYSVLYSLNNQFFWKNMHELAMNGRLDEINQYIMFLSRNAPDQSLFNFCCNYSLLATSRGNLEAVKFYVLWIHEIFPHLLPSVIDKLSWIATSSNCVRIIVFLHNYSIQYGLKAIILVKYPQETINDDHQLIPYNAEIEFEDDDAYFSPTSKPGIFQIHHSHFQLAHSTSQCLESDQDVNARVNIQTYLPTPSLSSIEEQDYSVAFDESSSFNKFPCENVAKLFSMVHEKSKNSEDAENGEASVSSLSKDKFKGTNNDHSSPNMNHQKLNRRNNSSSISDCQKVDTQVVLPTTVYKTHVFAKKKHRNHYNKAAIRNSSSILDSDDITIVKEKIMLLVNKNSQFDLERFLTTLNFEVETFGEFLSECMKISCYSGYSSSLYAIILISKGWTNWEILETVIDCMKISLRKKHTRCLGNLLKLASEREYDIKADVCQGITESYQKFGLSKTVRMLLHYDLIVPCGVLKSDLSQDGEDHRHNTADPIDKLWDRHQSNKKIVSENSLLLKHYPIALENFSEKMPSDIDLTIYFSSDSTYSQFRTVENPAII